MRRMPRADTGAGAHRAEDHSLQALQFLAARAAARPIFSLPLLNDLDTRFERSHSSAYMASGSACGRR